ncbi:MAG: hypothetical protein CL608_21265 [Anaerolineaceae bacterium]|nr:hypothetical protein [Anaerolineaceae bacterium]
MAEKHLVHLGWVLAADTNKKEVLTVSENVCHKLKQTLAQQFPQFRWQIDFVHRHRFAPKGSLNPLPLLELGVQEKIAQHWDYVIVAVPNALRARDRVHTIGIPSSALETAVLSTASLNRRDPDKLTEQMIMLSLHLLGHVWGIEHCDEGPMIPPETPEKLQYAPFPAFQQEIIVDRLEEVADQRLEEQSQQWNSVIFYWRAFWADPKSILIDIVGYAPWLLPFRMARLTAATAVSLLILLLTAEAWEMGVNLPPSRLIFGTVSAILIATGFIFAGKNLGQISRDVGWREQLTRTRLVVVGTILFGMVSLWLILFLFSLMVGWLLPGEVLSRWVQMNSVDRLMLFRHAAFMAMLGVLAGALGGNLEEDVAIKARLFFDEET